MYSDISAKQGSEIEEFLLKYIHADERLLVFDRHDDMCGSDNIPRMIKDEKYWVGGACSKVPPVSLFSNSCGLVYPKNHGAVSFGGHEFSFTNPSYIMHYGTRHRDCDANWNFLQDSDICKLAALLNRHPVAFHIDPDCLSEDAELQILGEIGSWNDCINRGRYYEFRERPDNPFFNGAFGDVSFDNLKSVFDLELSLLYIGEAFSLTERLGKYEEYYVKRGQEMIQWMSSEFLKSINHRTKAYIIDNGAKDFCAQYSNRKSVLNLISDAVSSLCFSEVVKLEYTWCAESLPDDLNNYLALRDEILKQKNPVIIGRTHATAGFALKDSVFEMR